MSFTAGQLIQAIGPNQGQSISNTTAQGLLSGPFVFPEIDFTTPGTYTFAIPNGQSVNLSKFGIRLTTLNGTITVQPTFSVGITGNNTKYLGLTQTSLLTGIGKREVYETLLADDAETSITFTIGTPASGSGAIKGTPYFEGVKF